MREKCIQRWRLANSWSSVPDGACDTVDIERSFVCLPLWRYDDLDKAKTSTTRKASGHQVEACASIYTRRTSGPCAFGTSATCNPLRRGLRSLRIAVGAGWIGQRGDG